MSKAVSIDLEPGEAFLRLNVDEEGATNFSCGFYPSNMNIEKDFDPEEDIDGDQLLTVFMAGMANLIQNDVESILRMGFEYLIAGNKPFDFIVDAEDVDYFNELSEEQLDLLRMDVQGEA